ncbi:acyl-CoA dehydrogenase [Saccharomonospora marina XMU15]|uniref:Acyl-CoA dehydrogenase n=1 Tax=Saccharomonospora marina XMU15 TaxID=882083 RepID=H5WZN9_9PSEU|nr:acyl-CoA dehydrogenase family protein [Saccharomonospora marina]EHR50771.1 acyl-CoA dehydrogenase [Saccharomonospora marina XMU15]
MNAGIDKLSPLLAPVLELAREHAAEVDGEARFPTEPVAALRESGLLGLTVPAEYGGLGCGPHEFADVVSALAAECGSTAMIYLMHVSATMPLARAAPAAMPGLLSEVAAGKVLASLALSERGSRSHFWAPVSRAAAEGDTLRVRADKSWVTSAGHADIYVASTLTPHGDAVDLVAIPATTPGITVSGDWRGLGLRGNASAPVTLDVELPTTARLGEAGGGFALMMEAVLPWFNLGNAAVSTGLAGAATDAATAHATAATFQHLEQSLSALPTIRAQLARMSIEVTGMRAMLRQTAEALARPGEDAMLHVLGSKAAANDAALRVTDAAMRVCGGAAFSQHLGIDRYFRDARAGHVMAPTADALYDFYGKALTGLPLF